MINMVNMTLALPDELHKIMRRHSEIKWSEVARRALWEYAERLEHMDELVADSKLTPEDVKELDIIVKKALSKRYREYKHEAGG